MYFFNQSMVLEEGTFPLLPASYNNLLLLNGCGLLAPAFAAPGHDVGWADER